MADINFAKKASIMKRNGYKDRFPCESQFSKFIVFL